jgi:hypothetical protein
VGKKKRVKNLSQPFRKWLATANIGASGPRVPMAAAVARRKSPFASSGSTPRRQNPAAILDFIGTGESSVSMAAAGSGVVETRVLSGVCC